MLRTAVGCCLELPGALSPFSRKGSPGGNESRVPSCECYAGLPVRCLSPDAVRATVFNNLELREKSSLEPQIQQRQTEPGDAGSRDEGG